MKTNGLAKWAAVALGSLTLIGGAVWTATTTFESRADHDADMRLLVDHHNRELDELQRQLTEMQRDIKSLLRQRTEIDGYRRPLRQISPAPDKPIRT